MANCVANCRTEGLRSEVIQWARVNYSFYQLGYSAEENNVVVLFSSGEVNWKCDSD